MANRLINAVANVAQVNSGMRVQVIPGARILKIVTRKFRPVSVELMPTMMIARVSESRARAFLDRDRRVLGPAGRRRAVGKSSDANSVSAATGMSQKLNMFSHGNATSRAPICNGITMLPSEPVTSGISTSHTMTVPCMVNNWLNV